MKLSTQINDLLTFYFCSVGGAMKMIVATATPRMRAANSVPKTAPNMAPRESAVGDGRS